MRILRVHPFLRSELFYPFAGGMARTSVRLTEELLRAGHNLAVFPYPDTFATPTQWRVGTAGNVPVRATLVWPGWLRIARWMRWARRLEPRAPGLQESLLDGMALTALSCALNDFRPEIIHNHLARRAFPRIYEGLNPGLPFVLTHHHFEPGESLASYDRIVFVSHVQRERVVQAGAVAQSVTAVVHNPVADEFRTTRLAPDEERHGIVYSGALIPRKGVDILLQAMALQPELKVQTLHLCGEGTLDSVWTRFVEDNGLDVRLHGKLTPGALSLLLSSAKVLALPSRQEGWSASINEAVCCGTAPVGYAAQIHELDELLGTPIGLAFDANTQPPIELGQLLVQALKGPLMRDAAREKMAAAARAYLSGERFAQAYERVYGELVGKGHTLARATFVSAGGKP